MSKDVAIKTTEVAPLTAEQTKEINTYLSSLGSPLREDQKAQFIALCREFSLNPFKREIYGVPYGDKFNIIVGYEVYIKRANRSNLLDGIERGTKGSGSNLVAWIKIYRKDWKIPLYHEVDYSEYVQLNKYKKPNQMWSTKPKTMLMKVATAQAFRLCFPEDFAGMPYTSDEIALEGETSGLDKTLEVPTVKPETTTSEPANQEPLIPEVVDNTPIKTKPPEQSGQLDEKRVKLWKMLTDLHGDGAQDALEKMTSFNGNRGFVPGKRDISRVSDKQVSFLIKKVTEEYNKNTATQHDSRGLSEASGPLPFDSAPPLSDSDIPPEDSFNQGIN
jgi:phage recombination protein Bet